jgi:spore germination cell wall hydrolase CwlJ-like protein
MTFLRPSRPAPTGIPVWLLGVAVTALIVCGLVILLAIANPWVWQGRLFDLPARLFGGHPSHSADSSAARTSPGRQTAAPPPVLRMRSMTPDQAVAYNRSVPVTETNDGSALPFLGINMMPTDRARAVDCLTAAIYYEAASESVQGRRAVAQVVLNRLAMPRFPKTVCGVVFQGAELATGCQFTFTCDGSLRRKPSKSGWNEAREIALAALSGFVEPSVGAATHYHTVWVAPYWSGDMVKVANIGAHIFYSWLGAGHRTNPIGAYAGQEPDVSALKAYQTALDGPLPVEPPPMVAQASTTPIAVTVNAPVAPMKSVLDTKPVHLETVPVISPVEGIARTTDTARLAPRRLAVPVGW